MGNKFNKFFSDIYQGSGTSIIIISWVLVSFHLTIYYKFNNCIVLNNAINIFNFIIWFFLIVIFFHFFIFLIFFLKSKSKIGKEKIIYIETTKRQSAYVSSKVNIIILPFYLLLVFSLSKLIVVFYQYYHKGIGEDIAIKIIILLAIFLGSLWAWCSFRETSTKIWSFWATVFAIGYILINIYWEYFLPYLKSYLSTINCIFKTIIAI